jgi:hypothetical protein
MTVMDSDLDRGAPWAPDLGRGDPGSGPAADRP